jgi:hypothetical protein
MNERVNTLESVGEQIGTVHSRHSPIWSLR